MMNSSTPLSKYIGKCVYCGSTDNLTDEHIVPPGLGGPWNCLAQVVAGVPRLLRTLNEMY